MKAEIITVGTVNEEGQPKGWEFDCKGQVAGINITEQGVLWGGYTVEELRQIEKEAHTLH